MDWEPISETGLWDLINQAELRMDPEVARFWEALRLVPEKWAQHPYGDEGNGFWVVGVIGSRVIWYNDIEDGFNVSAYISYGQIAEYWCDQHELELVLVRLSHAIRTGMPLPARASPPIAGVYRNA
jgi:hypothetical protein